MGLAELFLIADGRLPAGGHAHSYGLEAATRRLGVRDADAVIEFTLERLRSTGLTEAAITAHVCRRSSAGLTHWELRLLDAEIDARLPAPSQRSTSRQLGRQARRIGRAMWPDHALLTAAPASTLGDHQSVVWGMLADAADCTPVEAATLSLHHLATSMISAGVRLLALDPIDAHGRLTAAAPTISQIAERAATCSLVDDPADLPADTTPIADVLAELHLVNEHRLFQS